MNGNTKLLACRRLAISMALLSIWLGVSTPLSYGAGVWTNEPASASQITDWGFSTLTGPGWGDEGGSVSIGSDSSAPLSPSTVLQHQFYVGMPAGISPGNTWYLFPQPSPAVYLGFWWKASVGFQQHGSNRTKIVFLSDTGGNPLFFYMGGAQGSSYYIGMQHQNSDICNDHLSGYPGICGTWDIPSGATIYPGQWAKIELYVKKSTTRTSKDGILRYWVNGVLAREFTTMNFGQNLFSSVPIVPIWGGVGGTVTTPGTFSYDHMHVSIPSGGASSDQPPGPPAAPTIKNVTAP